jgi:predicted nucleotide-binding protein
MNIFLSFQARDIEYAAKITEAARGRLGAKAFGVDVKGMLGLDGMGDPDALYKALNAPEFAVVLLSNNYVSDGWFYQELPGLMRLEKHLGREFVLTVLVDDIPPEAIPTPLRNRRHIDLRGAHEKAGLIKLVERFQRAGRQESRRVFIIHGHNEAVKEETAGLLRQLGFEPVILQDLPVEGSRVIMEKFERHANVGFALALMTPDDLGQRKGRNERPQPRARQNVILELGYFIGKLGRERVCALSKGGVELPSDYHGIEYITIDRAGVWKTRVAQSLEAAGLAVDFSKLAPVERNT